MTDATADPVVNEPSAPSESQVLAPTIGLTAEHLESLYGLAHAFYSQKAFGKAEDLFGVLCTCDHRQDRFWIGLGACRQSRNDHAGAIAAYAMVDNLGIRNPLAPVRAAECYVALGNYELGLSGLQTALDWAEADWHERGINHVPLIKRIEELTSLIQQRLGATSSAADASEP